MVSAEVIRRDFDRIARATPPRPDALPQEERALVDLVPPGCRRALDVGCGAGALARALAARVERVVGIDLSPEMIRAARGQGGGEVDYVVGDFLATPFAPASFDSVVSVAALHHMPLEAAASALARVLAPGGVLLAIDLFHAGGLAELPYDLIELARRLPARLRRPSPDRELARAWAEHGRHDDILPFADLARRWRRALPGCDVRRGRGWRYRLAWTR